MDGLGHELAHGGVKRLSARRHRQGVDLLRDKRPHAAPRLDQPLALEDLVNLGDRERVDLQVGGELAHRGQLLTRLHLPAGNALLQLVEQLEIKGHPAGGMERDEHDVVLYMCNTLRQEKYVGKFRSRPAEPLAKYAGVA